MRIVDTAAWIEWLTGSPLGKKLGKEFPDKAECIVPTLVQLELPKWLLRETGEDRADKVIAYMQKCVVVPMDTRIALLGAELHRQQAGHRRCHRLRNRAGTRCRPAHLQCAFGETARRGVFQEICMMRRRRHQRD